MFYDCFDNPIICEVIDCYNALRIAKIGREDALEIIRERFYSESQDADDRPLVIIGTALALGRRNELTEEIRINALENLDELRMREPFANEHGGIKNYDNIVSVLSPKHIGGEKTYKETRYYDPGWNIGDTFVHAFSQAAAEKIGLTGWFVVFRKVGEYQNEAGRKIQLVYVTVCPPDAIPETEEELRSLGFLRMMEHDEGWDYLGQLSFKSKKDEELWRLTKIGCFPNAGSPNDATTESPLVSMPFFGRLKRNSNALDYEDLVCRLYRLRGINKGCYGMTKQQS